MRNRYTYLILILLPFYTIMGAKAQDFHLSQYDASGQFLNPALTGMYMGDDVDYSANLHHRTQWRSLGLAPFNTYMLGGDFVYDDRWGFGGYIVNNTAGLNNYRSLNFMLSAAYQITDDETNTHILTTGVQMGLLNKSFNMNDMIFDRQYDSSTGMGNSSLASGENFQNENLYRFDANIGVFYKYQDDENMAHPFLGVSVFHLTMPDESFTSEKERLPMRWVVHSGVDLNINDQLTVTPMVLYMNQANAWEFNLGAMAWYNIDDTKYDVMLGTFYRFGDAAIIQAGFRQDERVTLRLSYDMNTSMLNTFTRGRGGFEIGLIYRGKKGYNPIPRFN